MCPSALYVVLRVSGLKTDPTDVSCAAKTSPVKCLKRIHYRCTILVRPVLPRTGLCDPYMSGTYLFIDYPI